MISFVFVSLWLLFVIAMVLGTYSNSRRRRRIREIIQGLIDAEADGKPGTLAGLDVLLAMTVDPPLLTFKNSLIPERLEFVAQRTQSRETEPELLTGDAGFDAEVLVQGDPDGLLAVLDHETRRQVRSEVLDGATLKECMVQKDLRRPEDAGCALRLARLAGRLGVATEDIQARLALHATTDPTPEFRVRCLRQLRDSFPRSEHCSEAHRQCLRGTERTSRLEAAEYFARQTNLDSSTARRTCAVLAKIATDSKYSDAMRAAALAALCRRRWRAVALRVLDEVVAEPDTSDDLQTAVVEGLVRLRFREAIPQLIKLSHRARGQAAEALATALGKMGDVAAQPCLLGLMARHDSSLRLCAIEALAKVGDAGAVEALLALAQSDRTDEETSAARSAVLRIQHRIVGGEAGQLSLVNAAGTDGALSPAENAAGPGALSLDGEPPERPN